MRTARLLLFSLLAAWPGAGQTFDTSGNGMLKGTYYFREVFYVVNPVYGGFEEAAALYNIVTFDGAGHYSLNAQVYDSNATGVQRVTSGGTYSISASGYGFLSNPLSAGDFIFGVVGQSGVFVGSSTESGFNDLLIAAPAPSSASAANTAFKGAYTIADLDLTAGVTTSVAYATDAMFQLNPDGAGNLGPVNISGYAGVGGASVYTQNIPSGLKYALGNGSSSNPFFSILFPLTATATFLSGQKYIYISPDGNFIFGGSPNSFDFFVGVRTGGGTPTFGGLYYQAGEDEDFSTPATGAPGLLDSYYGSLTSSSGTIVGHQRLNYGTLANNAVGFTYADSYSVKADGTYTNGSMNFAVGAGGAVRVGVGIGPILGINVALAAPSPSGSGVFINPQGVVNAASFAPFTAGVSPGDLITIYGSNLAMDSEVASSIPFPKTLGGVQVTVNNVQAPIYAVSPGQISAIVPYSTTGSIANIQVNNNGTLSNTVTELNNATTPGIFTLPPGGLGSAAALHADFSLVTTQKPAQPGETISLYLTGLGAVTPGISDGAAGPSTPLSKTNSPVTADIAGIAATVTYSGLAPQLAGLYQVNMTIPSKLTPGNYVLDLYGPDSWAGEALIPVGTAGTTGAAAPVPAASSRAKAFPNMPRENSRRTVPVLR